MGMTITVDQANVLLINDVQHSVNAVNRLAGPCKQGQFDALVDFVFNLGEGALASSTLLKKHRARDYEGAAKEFQRWVHAGKKVLPGLVKRRAAEAVMYRS